MRSSSGWTPARRSRIGGAEAAARGAARCVSVVYVASCEWSVVVIVSGSLVDSENACAGVNRRIERLLSYRSGARRCNGCNDLRVEAPAREPRRSDAFAATSRAARSRSGSSSAERIARSGKPAALEVGRMHASP